MKKKMTTYTATVTETFDIGEERVVLVRGEEITLSENAAEILLGNGQVTENEG